MFQPEQQTYLPTAGLTVSAETAHTLLIAAFKHVRVSVSVRKRVMIAFKPALAACLTSRCFCFALSQDDTAAQIAAEYATALYVLGRAPSRQMWGRDDPVDYLLFWAATYHKKNTSDVEAAAGD